MFLESGARRPNPYNPNPPHKRVPLDLKDPSSLIVQPQPELPSDGRFTASTGDDAVARFAVQAEVLLMDGVEDGLHDARARDGYI